MDTNLITYLACICFLFLFGKIFIVPIKKILKLVINSVLGGIAIFLINLIGGIWGFHIGLNVFTSILVGLLGLPGAVCLIIVKLLIGWDRGDSLHLYHEFCQFMSNYNFKKFFCFALQWVAGVIAKLLITYHYIQ